MFPPKTPLPVRHPTASICCAALFAVVVPAQAPAPGGAAFAGSLEELGNDLLEREDPVAAWDVFRRVAERANLGEARAVAQVGLGRSHLMLGRSAFAVRYAEAAITNDPQNQNAMALCIRSLIRARAFDDAVVRSALLIDRVGEPGAELLAASASALFRVQRIDDAAARYQAVLAREPLHPEANLRLGSGLLPPVDVEITPVLRAAADAAVAGEREKAIGLLLQILGDAPGHPVAHRLLGEVVFAQRAAASMVASDPAFVALRAALPQPSVRGLPVAQFVPGYEQLSPRRRAVVDRVAATFARHLPKLVAIGGSHDLLQELDRTTDAKARTNLRGRRTFDGRVWDDVRGVGGIQAATGIEALDEATQFGFDTLAHEVAHQVHLFAFTPVQKARVRALYQSALAEGRCLDYYAASNEAEYFGQGVEAFVSFGKHPGGETTHGHTRFELFAQDRELHDFIAGVVANDPLADPVARGPLLEAAVAVAIRCGRSAEAIVAATMLEPGPDRERLLAAAEAAARAARCH